MNTKVEKTDKSEVALREEAMMAFWAEHDVFKKSLETPAGNKPVGDFVFYDGPPFATGLPHYGHILAGTIKDAIPRFWTMQGYRVRRKWGWDCHGLPLENLIEKKLGLSTKRDIEEFGVKNFNEAARSAVLEYADDWAKIVPRMGRWADMEDDYKTMDSSYTESVWWVFSELHKKGLVYEGFKSMHLCPRCGTTLSNFEVNQGYKDIKDIAITVKLPLVDEPDSAALLVWTTTPWTMPGNMAAAVHNDYEYAKVKVKSDDGEEYVILAKERLTQLATEEYEVVETIKGSDLVGRRYTQPFPYYAERDFAGKENAWQILHADYVELGEEGTGAVHLAPAYGDDDMVLAQDHGVPIEHHVDADGHFMSHITDFAGQLVKPKDDEDAEVSHLDADIEIVKALKANGRLYRKENITHSYPHCWRCDTPLLNYATTSWFVEVTKIKDELVAANNTVHWVPEAVGKNRFGKWLEGARDWAVSRQRYWGAPLPIWRNPETKEIKVFGSLTELQEYAPKSGNTYLTMRHGESEKNVTGIVTDAFDAPYPLTEKGKADAVSAAAAYKGKIDLIVTSPVLRAKETAEVVATELGLSTESVVVDERLRELEHGVYDGKTVKEYYGDYPVSVEKFEQAPEGGETYNQLRARMGDCLDSLEAEYKDKTILIVSHGDPLMMLRAISCGKNKEQIVADWQEHYAAKGVIDELGYCPVPRNDEYELDFHRPYIDNFVLEEDGVQLERVPDVFDCWFESGSMPYGQHHYPYADKDSFEKEHFPANFIAEGLDQTRGWFYSLIVLGTALFGKSPYENVIVNGLVLAEDGKKMSKSLQNYPDPMDLADRVGVDAMRHYLLSAPIMRGEDLNFSEKEVLELQRKNIGRLHNVLALYEQSVEGAVEPRSDSTHVLDQWIIARLNQLVSESTVGYKNYELDKATRPLNDFIDDLSVWYLRRSRDRLKGEDVEDKAAALATLSWVLHNLARVMAPAMPFYAEYLFQAIRNESDPISVHLTAWPKEESVATEVLEAMSTTREVVSAALEKRAQASVKVRQPLATLTTNASVPETHVPLILDEVNVKVIEQNVASESLAELDLTVTPELQAEGDAREFVRAVQGMRKTAGLEPSDRIALTVQTSQAGEVVLSAHQESIVKTVGADTLNFDRTAGEEIEAGEHQFTVNLVKQ